MVVQNETCTYANGSVFAGVSGGVPPYTYLWGGGETTDGLTGLGPGTYTVTVTDFVGTQVSDQATVISENHAALMGITHAYCPGQNYHDFFIPVYDSSLGDLGPWSSSIGSIAEVPPPAAPGNLYIDLGTMAPDQSYSLTYWDVNGCQGTMTGIAGAPITSWPSFAVVDIQGSCANVGNGQVTFTSSPDVGTDTYYVLRPESGGDMDYINTFGIVAPDVFSFYALPPGNYWLRHRLGFTYSLIQGGDCSSDSILVTIPNLGPTCGSITGSTYMDYNSDCIDTEANASNVVVEIQPGPIYTTSGGGYSVVVPNGNYTMTTSGAAIAQSCPASATVNGNSVTSNIGHQPTIPLDVAIGLASGPARPGFQLFYNMIVQNLSSSASGATTTTFTFDPTVSFISAWPSGSVAGNTITWNQPSLDIFQEREYRIWLQVPPDVGLIGTVIPASAEVSTANTDGDLANNTTNAAITVTGSYDPNDKTAYTSTRASNSLYFINEDEWIDYVIRFQNTGTDTAFNVVVTDTLPSTLDPATISLVTASHANTWSLQGQGTLKFIFPNILLPDSNVNEPLSHGLISFRIRPKQPVLPGTTIENIANIYFDFNPPVITEPSVLVAEFSTGVHEIADPEVILLPNPARDAFEIRGLGQDLLGVTLLSIDGRTVRSFANANGDRRFMVGGIPSGAYLVELTLRNGTATRLPLIIEHH